jgi:hypothetical protein
MNIAPKYWRALQNESAHFQGSRLTGVLEKRLEFQLRKLFPGDLELGSPKK